MGLPPKLQSLTIDFARKLGDAGAAAAVRRGVVARDVAVGWGAVHPRLHDARSRLVLPNVLVQLPWLLGCRKAGKGSQRRP